MNKLIVFTVQLLCLSTWAQTHEPFSYRIFQPKPIVYSGLTGTKKLALTFDDGPDKGTPELLELLHDEHIQATFFINGIKVNAKTKKYLDIMQADGHIVANHTESHPILNDKYVADPKSLISQIDSTHKKIAPYNNHHRWYFRAPYGVWRKAHADVLNADAVLKSYIGPILWEVGGEIQYDTKGNLVGSADWDCWQKKWTPERCAVGYVREAKRRAGGVVLFHDVSQNVTPLVQLFVTEMRAAGYSFVTLDDVREFDQYE